VHGKLPNTAELTAYKTKLKALRGVPTVEDPQFTRDYHDPDKRPIANALTVEFSDGSRLPEIVVEYPIGHKRRRKEGMPILVEKFETNLARVFAPKQADAILELCLDAKRLAATPVNEFVDLMAN
jgi:2-methylcitrate dehydratase